MNNKRPEPKPLPAKGWIGAHQWLLARRLCQLALLALFLLGPLAGCGSSKGIWRTA
jgi:ferredoxin-type protein NapH